MASTQDRTTTSAQEEATRRLNENLIEEIRNTPIIFNFRLKENKDIIAKENAWRKVAEAMNLSVDAVQKKWKGLRDRYTREKKKIEDGKASGAGVEDDIRDGSKFEHFDSMSFLNGFIKHRATTGNMSIPTAKVTDPEDCNKGSSSSPLSSGSGEGTDSTTPVHVEGEPSESPTTISSSASSTGLGETSTTLPGPSNQGGEPRRKRRKESEGSDKFEENMMASIQSLTTVAKGFFGTQNNQKSHTMDEDDLFGCTVATSLKRLQPRMKGLAKMSIQQTLWQMEFNEAYIQAPPTPVQPMVGPSQQMYMWPQMPPAGGPEDTFHPLQSEDDEN
jgi:hypothetical protein